MAIYPARKLSLTLEAFIVSSEEKKKLSHFELYRDVVMFETGFLAKAYISESIDIFPSQVIYFARKYLSRSILRFRIHGARHT